MKGTGRKEISKRKREKSEGVGADRPPGGEAGQPPGEGRRGAGKSEQESGTRVTWLTEAVPSLGGRRAEAGARRGGAEGQGPRLGAGTRRGASLSRNRGGSRWSRSGSSPGERWEAAAEPWPWSC